jgi:hypothetical protein
MWDPRRLTTLWASTACCMDSLTFLFLPHDNYRPFRCGATTAQVVMGIALKVWICRGHFYDFLLNIKSHFNAISHTHTSREDRMQSTWKLAKKKSLPHVANSNLLCEFSTPQQKHTEKRSTQWRFNQTHWELITIKCRSTQFYLDTNLSENWNKLW